MGLKLITIKSTKISTKKGPVMFKLSGDVIGIYTETEKELHNCLHPKLCSNELAVVTKVSQL